jgi:DNA invertase Pin-like site-specific DNA recombinase
MQMKCFHRKFNEEEPKMQAKPKLIRRKSAKSVITQTCENCSAQVNLHLVSAKPEALYSGKCESCGERVQVKEANAKARRVIGYLRVSTQDQDLEKNKADILALANSKGLGPVVWVVEKISGLKDWRKRELGKVIDSLNAGSWLITSEFSRLARSTLQILEILAELKKKNVNVYIVKNDQHVNDSIQSKVFLHMMALFAEIERDLISARTKEALKARKASGVKLGRPKGHGKSKLDQYRPEIEALLKNGSTQRFIAKRYGCSEANLNNWLKKNNIDRTPVL